jgi:hypothetical protein
VQNSGVSLPVEQRGKGVARHDVEVVRAEQRRVEVFHQRR